MVMTNPPGHNAAMHVKGLYDKICQEAEEWKRFRRDVLETLSPNAPNGGQPGRHPATDTLVFLVFPPNPGRTNATFFNDGGAAKCYLIFSDVNNPALTAGFSWALAAGQGTSLMTLVPGYRGTVYAQFTAVDAATVLGFTEFIS